MKLRPLASRLFYLLFIALHLSLFLGCSKLSEVRVVGRNFEEEIQLVQNLVFTFNKDIVTESDLNSWQSGDYVNFTPAVAGKFQWTAANELVFSPSEGFLPATEYKASLGAELSQKVKGKKLSVSSDDIAFHTPYLQLGETETWWTKSRETGKPIAKTKLHFNYAVDANEVGKKLKINGPNGLPPTPSDRGGAISSLPIGSGSGQPSGLIFSLPNLQVPDETTPLSFVLEKGIKVPNSSYQTTEDIEGSTALPSPKQIEITDVKTGFENNRAYVRVSTTQELQATDLQKYYAIEPMIETKAELTENGFIIRGEFNETDTYSLTLTAQIKGVLGVRLAEAVTRDLFFGPMPANIEFVNKKAIYLSSKGSRNVGINITNIPKVQLRVAKVYENNILAFLRSNRYEDYNYDEEAETTIVNGFQYSEDNSGLYSDIIQDKTIETSNLPKVRGVSALNLALPDENSFRGIYIVNITSRDEQYKSATKLVSISDIGLIAKKTDNEIWIFANSIKTAEPISGVEINLISSNNQSVYSLKTDANGIARFEKITEKAPNFRIEMITAKTAEDFNYLIFSDTQVETSRFEVEGERDNTTGYSAFVYGQREIYRPGETLYFNTVIRTEQRKSVGEVPILIKITMPNGKELKAFRKTTNDDGAVETTLTLDAAAVTGTYNLEVYNANNVLLTSKNISVEEFMPDRIKVDLKADREQYTAGQTVNLTATAVNLFGPPASGRNYEMDFSLKRKAFYADKFREYSFNINGDTKFENQLRQGITNENGIAKEGFQIPAGFQDIGLLEGKIYSTVFDENGRPVNRLKRFEVMTQPALYGIRIADHYTGLNTPMVIDLVAVDAQQNLVSNHVAQLEVIRIEYQNVIEKQDDQIRYVSKKREKQVYFRTITFKNGKAAANYAPTVSGEYEIRVHRAGAASATTVDFYAYGWGNTSASSFEVSNEGQVLMEFDKPKYEVGDKATVLFKTPFAGKLLVTIERNKVLEYKYLDTDKKSATFSFNITEDHLPNVYLTATLIRPLDASSLPLTVAHGFAPVNVEDKDTKLPIEIVSVEKSRSKTKQKIKVKTARNAQVTIAVVDEGILQLKNTKTPDIHGFFYQKRALEVGSHDLYAFLFPELALSGISSTGGDGYDLEKRINPLSNGRVKLVAFWSGLIDTGLNGEAEFEVDIPQFSGDLRVMAVAYKDNAFGSGNTNIKVADPLVLSTSLPRFLSPDDEVIVPVNITNTEKKSANVKVSIAVSGSVQSQTPNVQNLSINAEKEARATFTVKAAQMMGNGSVTITVDNGKEKFVEKTEITVRPATSLLKTSQSGLIAGGSSGTISLTTDMIPSTVKGKLIISRSPMVQYAKALDYLLGYPHGCIEQTVSKAFPQLYFADMAKSLKAKTYIVKSGESDFNPTFNVQAAIQKIESMQLYNGALSYWPSGNDESWWGTAYAVHFLIEAQRAGYEVSQSHLGKMLDYLTLKTNTPATEVEYIYNESGTWTQNTVASRSTLYSLYVLAQAGKANRATMNYYKQNSALLTTDSRYLLWAAFRQIGSTIADPASRGGFNGQAPSGALGASPIRNLALTLNSLIETDPNNLQIPALARQLSQALNATSYLNTQEAAFSFLALGKLAKKNANSTVTAKIAINGKQIAAFDGKDLTVSNPLIAHQPSLVTTQGKGSLYWFAQIEGLSMTNNYVEEDVNLRVRKQFFNRNGQAISSFRQNDLVVVKITLTSTSGTPVENVVVTDLLPAGFEIENPRLTEPREMPWIKNATPPDYFDMRDDRINYYTTANNQEKTFYYMVRAVSRGTFVMGPVSADAMYSADYRSYSGGGKVKVD